MPLILDVEKEYQKIKMKVALKKNWSLYGNIYWQTKPFIFCKRISEDLGGPKIYFKRDELNHTGAQNK